MEVKILENDAENQFKSVFEFVGDKLIFKNCNVIIYQSDISELNNKEIQFDNCIINTNKDLSGKSIDSKINNKAYFGIHDIIEPKHITFNLVINKTLDSEINIKDIINEINKEIKKSSY